MISKRWLSFAPLHPSIEGSCISSRVPCVSFPTCLKRRVGNCDASTKLRQCAARGSDNQDRERSRLFLKCPWPIREKTLGQNRHAVHHEAQHFVVIFDKGTKHTTWPMIKIAP